MLPCRTGASETEHFLTVADTQLDKISLSEHSRCAAAALCIYAPPYDIGSYRWSNCKGTIQEPLLFIVTDIARDDEALQATTKVNNPKCKGMTRRY